MKIKILTEGLNDIDLQEINTGLEDLKILIPSLNFTIEETNKKFTSFPFKNKVASGYLLNNEELLPLVSGKDDIVCLVYDWTKIKPQPTNPSSTHIIKGKTIPFSIPKQWYNHYVNVFVDYFLHELSHSEAFRSGKRDLTHEKYNPMWAGRWNQQSNTDYYLYLLKDYMSKSIIKKVKDKIIKPITHYKYFAPKEVVGLKPKLVEILDKARGLAGIPFVITSGLRTPAQNKKVGGVSNSAHLRGLASDIRCNNKTRQKILKGLLETGEPLFIEDAKRHIHIDIDNKIHNLGDMIVSGRD